jgi:hypothetical protein
MMKTPSRFVRASAAALLLVPTLLPLQAAAQVVSLGAASAASGAASVSAAAAAARAPLSINGASVALPALNGTLAPALNAAPAPSAFSAAAAPAAFSASPSAAAPAAAPASAAPAQAPISARGAYAGLDGAARPDADAAAISSAERLDALFNGAAVRRAAAESAPVASAATASAPSALAPSSRSGKTASKALLAGAAGLAASLPSVAHAAVLSGPITSESALSLLAGIHPLASAVGSVAGMIYGLFVSRAKDESEASAGAVFSSMLRYGTLGGAAVYVLLNMTQMVFSGASAAGIAPLASAVTTASLGRAAFSGRFAYASTTSMERFWGAFPAVAAAVGVSIAAAALVAPIASVTVGTSAMAATGLLSAVYAYLYKPGYTPLNGPAAMARGYVVQALMTGLALSMSNPVLFWSFAAMAGAGFAQTLWSTLMLVWDLYQSRASATPPYQMPVEPAVAAPAASGTIGIPTTVPTTVPTTSPAPAPAPAPKP